MQYTTSAIKKQKFIVNLSLYIELKESYAYFEEFLLIPKYFYFLNKIFNDL